MKLTKGPDSPQSGEGTTHEVRSLPTKVRGVDKGTDNAPGLQDIFFRRRNRTQIKSSLEFVI